MAEADRRVTLGRVAGVFGVKGWVKIASNTRPADNILKYPQWWIGAENGYAARLVDAKAQVNGIIASITGRDGQPITDRDVAAAMVGKDIAVDRSALPPAPAGSYYWSDLIGMRVVSKEGVALGTVTAMMENGAQDVLVLQEAESGGASLSESAVKATEPATLKPNEGPTERPTERLIPFVQGPIIVSVDVASGLIVADWALDY